jgi:hypothetical protein
MSKKKSRPIAKKRAPARRRKNTSTRGHSMSEIASEMVLVLRVCHADMSSSRGFVWPREGVAEAPDWSPTAECGRGLHGWLWGEGDINVADQWASPDAVWLVVEVAKADVVDLQGKVKFPRGRVLFSGKCEEAVSLISAAAPRGSAIIFGTATAGVRGTATAGYGGTATAGDSGTATAGYGGTATAGYGGTATAGDSGTLLLRHWDVKLDRYRWIIGDVGLDGIEADVPYKLDENGKLIKVVK